MKLAKALKVKNSLINEINTLKAILVRENSRESTSTSNVNRADIWEKILSKTDELIALKAKIATANIGIYKFLAQMEEAKSQIEYVKTIPVTDGTFEKANGYGKEPTKIVYSAYIKQADVDYFISSLQKKIESLQDDIDSYNATTEI